MKRLVLTSTTLALLTGIALAAPAQAGSSQHRTGVTHSERMAIANSRQRLNALKARVHADGRVNLWERARLRAAEARHRSLAYRLRHN